MKANSKLIFALIIAVFSEVSLIGLLATSGWFIVASALAGLSIYSTFSYLVPSAFVRLFAITRIGFNYWQRLLSHRISMNKMTDNRVKFFQRAVSQSQRYQLPASGVLLDRLQNDTEESAMGIIRVTLPIVVTVTTGIIGAFVLSIWSVWLSAILTVYLVAVFTLNYLVYLQRSRRQSDRYTRGGVRDELLFAQNSWLDLRSLNADVWVANRLESDLSTYNQQSTNHRLSDLNLNFFNQLITGAFLIEMAVAVVFILHLNSESFALIILMVAGLVGLTNQIPTVVNQQLEIDATNHKLSLDDQNVKYNRRDFHLELTDEKLDVADYKVPANALAKAQTIGFSQKINQVVVLTGISGVGKTSFLEALKDKLKNQARISYVDDYIFTGNIRDNLLIGTERVSDSDLKRMLASVGLQKLSLNTQVGDAIRTLSGGEVTRISVLRAMLAKPRVLLLDEPFAGLDTKAQQQVADLIENYASHNFVVLIDHEQQIKLDNVIEVKFKS
jgi:ATP-binding cassette subfamily C protein CydC